MAAVRDEAPFRCGRANDRKTSIFVKDVVYPLRKRIFLVSVNETFTCRRITNAKRVLNMSFDVSGLRPFTIEVLTVVVGWSRHQSMPVFYAEIAHGNKNDEFLNATRYFESIALRPQKNELRIASILPDREVTTICSAFDYGQKRLFQTVFSKPITYEVGLYHKGKVRPDVIEAFHWRSGYEQCAVISILKALSLAFQSLN
jgi:hypothetical protein